MLRLLSVWIVLCCVVLCCVVLMLYVYVCVCVAISFSWGGYPSRSSSLGWSYSHPTLKIAQKKWLRMRVVCMRVPVCVSVCLSVCLYSHLA